MSKIFYAGDLHGNLPAYKSIDEYCETNQIPIVIQLGDSGILWSSQCKVADHFNQRRSGPTWITLGGNHDNWPLWRTLRREVVSIENLLEPVELTRLANRLYFADRSTTCTVGGLSHIFYGGATSTDRSHRRWGLSMWVEAEEPTTSEWNRFADALLDQPQVVCTHECPSTVNLYREAREQDLVVRALQAVLTTTQEEHPMWNPIWFYGHHHNLQRQDTREGSFFNGGIDGEGFILDTQTMEITERRLKRWKM